VDHSQYDKPQSKSEKLLGKSRKARGIGRRDETVKKRTRRVCESAMAATIFLILGSPARQAVWKEG